MSSDEVWHRLDGRMLVVAPLQHIVRLLPVLLVLLITGRGDPIRLWITVGLAGLLVALGIVRWRTTRYRITAERVELHSGWLRRQRRSVPRDRLRTVDATSTLLHRMFGLSVLHVRAATGASADHQGLKLDAVTTAEAERLRRLLLAEPGVAGPRVGGAGPVSPATSTSGAPGTPDAGTTGAGTTGAGTTGAGPAGGRTAGTAGAAMTGGHTARSTDSAGTAGAGTGGPDPGDAGHDRPAHAAIGDPGPGSDGAGHRGATDPARVPDPGVPAPDPDADEGVELARLRWSWIRFAPLTVSSLAGAGAILAAVWNVFNELGVRPGDVPLIDRTAEQIFAAAIWVTVGVLGAVVLVVAVVGALLIFTERWWGYRLLRAPDGTLRVRRGLLTQRSLSVAGARLRGVAVSEPLLLRAGRGAQIRALATGLGRGSQGGALQPPAPRAEAHRLASVVLDEPPERATRAALLRHPPHALRRRLTRALGPAALLVGIGWLVGTLAPGWAWLGPASLALPVLAVPLALDRYRNLGHLLTDRHLLTRLGCLHRRTVALERTGVIGWTFRQSVFQRRAGLVTVEAVTAAGDGGYLILDVDAARGVELAAAVVPGVLDAMRSAPPAGAEQAAGDLTAQGAGRGPQERLHHG